MNEEYFGHLSRLAKKKKKKRKRNLLRGCGIGDYCFALRNAHSLDKCLWGKMVLCPKWAIQGSKSPSLVF